MSGCIGPMCVSCNNALSQRSDNQFSHIIRTRHQNCLRTSKQLVYVLFSEMMSSSSIFSYYKVNQRVPSKKERKNNLCKVITCDTFSIPYHRIICGQTSNSLAFSTTSFPLWTAALVQSVWLPTMIIKCLIITFDLFFIILP